MADNKSMEQKSRDWDEWLASRPAPGNAKEDDGKPRSLVNALAHEPKVIFRLNGAQFLLLTSGILFGIGAGVWQITHFQSSILMLAGAIGIVMCARPEIWHRLQQVRFVGWLR